MRNIFSAARKRIQGTFFGWWIVLSACFIQSMNQGLLTQGFTVYFLPLQAEFGWSRALLSAGFSTSHVETGILGPLEGWLADKFGPRRGGVLGVILLGVGFILLSRVQTIVAFFGAFFVISAGSSLCGLVPLMVAVFNWFVRRRTLALGIAMAGSGLGGIIVPLVAWSMTNQGWRTTALISGIVIWLIGIPLALFMRHKPEQYGYLPDGDRPASSEARPQEQEAGKSAKTKPQADDYFSPKEALRTGAFWLIAAGHASAVLMVSAINLHLAPHLVQQLKISLEAAGSIVALVLLISIIGRVVGGFLADRINKKILLVTCMLSHTIGLLILTYATNMAQVVLFAIFHGMAWGARAPTQNSIRAEYFGRKSIGLILGLASIMTTVASIIAPIFAGWLSDVRGDYRVAFTILAFFTGFGSLFFAFARKPIRKSRPAGGEAAAG